MRFLLVGTFILASGCGAGQPRTAADKWAAALDHPDAKVRKKAVFTLGNIGPSDAATLPALIKALADPDPGVRCEAILGVLKLGEKNRQAVPYLLKLQRTDSDSKVRRYAGRALEKIVHSG